MFFRPDDREAEAIDDDIRDGGNKNNQTEVGDLK